MCYHLLAGAPPFSGETPLDVLKAHLTRRPRPLRELNPDVPPQMEQAIARMMAREPVARYASVAEALVAMGLEVEDEAGALPFSGAFVGRQAELGAFQDALRALKREGQGGALWIAGGTGTGKTRLLEEFRVLARLDEVPFFEGPCTDRGTPYGPFVRLLRPLLPVAGEALDGLSAEQRAALGLILPELAKEGGPSQTDPHHERLVLQSAIAHVLRTAVGPTGAVLALDDWDRADAASVECLAYLRRNAQGVPFWIVGLGREAGYLDPSATTLPPLTPDEVAALAGSMLGMAQPPEELATALSRWTGGHAGHVQRVVEHLVRTGAIRRDGARWVFPDDWTAADLGADFRELVLAPLSALTGPAVRLAELTAVLGAGADLETLAALSGLDEETMFAALDELRTRQIVRRSESGIAFASGALEDAVYGRLNEGQRLWLHAAAAARLEETAGAMPGDAAIATALTRHYLRSLQTAKALPAALRAADLNMAIFAVDTARELLRDALALVAEAPDQHAHWRRDGLGRLVAVERWRGDFEAMGACLEEALPLAERLGEPAPFVRLLLQQGGYFIQRMTASALKQAIAVLGRAAGLAGDLEPALQAQVRFNLGQGHFYLGQLAEARAAFEAAVALGEAAGLPFWRAKGLAFVGYLMATGEKATRDEGIARLAEAATIQHGLGDKYGHGFTAALQGEALWQLLRLPEAEAAFRAQIAINDELGVVDDHTTGLVNLTMVYALAGRHQEALATGEQALALATQFGHPVGLLARAATGYALAATGDLRRAGEALSAAEAAGQGEGGYMFAHAVPFLLLGWLALGRHDEVRRLAEEALYRFRSDPNPALQAQVAALLGEACFGLGEPDAAGAHAEEAWAIARAADHALGKLLALRLRARLALAGGRLEEARQAAEQALEQAERAGAGGFAAEAAWLLGESEQTLGLGGAPSRFRAVQYYADTQSVPFWRALALFGQASAGPASDRSEALALEAQQIVRSLAEGLEPLARAAFLSAPACQRVLSGRVRVSAPLSFEGGHQVFERVMAVSQELQSFATQYGALFQEWVASNRRLEMLNALARRLDESLDLEDVLPQVAALTLELTGAERAFVLLNDAALDQLTCRASVDRHGSALPDARLSMSVCRRVVASGAPVTILDATLSDELHAQASIADLNLRTLMCVPLSARGQTLGVLYVDSQAVVMTFTRKDLELLTAIAGHASLAIANATLYAESVRRADELARTLELYHEASLQANTDPLTGLANRRNFEVLAEREREARRRHGHPLSLLALDVDHFKSFNDTYGHAVGDEVLKAVAEVLRRCVRACDLPARLGGEEFVVLCRETSVEGATVLAERIREEVEALELKDAGGNPLRRLTVSVGVADVDPAADLAEALNRADSALYACKRAGRNQVQTWREGLDMNELEAKVPAAKARPARKR
jgi:diguanylate cyclase (GGDEF)-like protein